MPDIQLVCKTAPEFMREYRGYCDKIGLAPSECLTCLVKRIDSMLRGRFSRKEINDWMCSTSETAKAKELSSQKSAMRTSDLAQTVVRAEKVPGAKENVQKFCEKFGWKETEILELLIVDELQRKALRNAVFLSFYPDG